MSPAFTAATPLTPQCHHVIRPGTGSESPCGGVRAIIRKHIPNVNTPRRKFTYVECTEEQFDFSNDKTVAYLLYRPVGHFMNDFIVDFESSLIESQLFSNKKNYMGDFNVWMGQQNTNEFCFILNIVGQKVNVNKSTHNLRCFLKNSTPRKNPL